MVGRLLSQAAITWAQCRIRGEYGAKENRIAAERSSNNALDTDFGATKYESVLLFGLLLINNVGADLQFINIVNNIYKPLNKRI